MGDIALLSWLSKFTAKYTSDLLPNRRLDTYYGQFITRVRCPISLTIFVLGIFRENNCKSCSSRLEGVLHRLMLSINLADI